MNKYELSCLFDPTRTSWPEASRYIYRGETEHELILFYSNPTTEEIQAVQSSEAEFRLHVAMYVFLLLYRFGEDEIPWSDAPYSFHLVPDEERVPPPPLFYSHKEGILRIVLVDADTGIIKALRTVPMPAQFATSLVYAVDVQAHQLFDRDGYDGVLRTIRKIYPDSADIVKDAQQGFNVHSTR